MSKKPLPPLRKIVERINVEIADGVDVVKEKLECGHIVSPGQDIYGHYYASRRRCRQCLKIATNNPDTGKGGP